LLRPFFHIFPLFATLIEFGARSELTYFWISDNNVNIKERLSIGGASNPLIDALSIPSLTEAVERGASAVS